MSLGDTTGFGVNFLLIMPLPFFFCRDGDLNPGLCTRWVSTDLYLQASPCSSLNCSTFCDVTTAQGALLARIKCISCKSTEIEGEKFLAAIAWLCR